MTTLEAVRTALTQNAALAALVSDRVYFLQAAQGTEHPFVVLTVVSDTPENSLTGSPDTRLITSRVQVDAYARTYIQAQQVADAVLDVLGALLRPDLNAFLVMKQDIYEDETRLYRVSSDYQVARG